MRNFGTTNIWPKIFQLGLNQFIINLTDQTNRMNELQKKLARRRSLNGEQFAAQEISCDTEGTATPPARDSPKHFNTKGTPPQFPDSAKTSKASELQSKLARRRDLNGEAGSSASNTAESTIPAPASVGPENVVPVFKVMKRADSNASTASQSQSRSSSLADAEGPAWLNDFASSVQSKEPFQDNEQSSETLQVEAPLTPHIEHDAAVAASIIESVQATEDRRPARGVEKPPSPVSPTSDIDEPPPEACETPEGYKADTEETAVSQSDTTTENAPAHAVTEESASLQHCEPVSVDPHAHEPTVSAHVDTSLIDNQAEPEPTPVDVAAQGREEVEDNTDTSPEEAEAALMVPALHDVPSRPASPQEVVEAPTAPPSSELAEGTVQPAAMVSAAGLEQTEVPHLSLQTEVDTNNSKSEKRDEPKQEDPNNGNSTPPAHSTTSDTKKIDQSPQRARGGWSPKRTTTTTVPASTAKLPTVDTGNTTANTNNTSSPAYLRANTNPGTAPTGSFSPLRRTNSFAGVNPTPTHQPTPVRKTSWYPGKFLIEGPAGWGSKNSTPMMKMNPDQARSHYADLLSSSAKDVPKSASLSPKNGAQASAKKELSRQEQRQEDLRTAHIPESVAAGTSDDIIEMVLQLSRENSQLKKEVAHLKGKLAHQQVLLDAFQGASIEEFTSDGAESATSRSTAAERRGLGEGAAMAKGSHITYPPQSSADTADSEPNEPTEPTEPTERTSLTEAPLTPNASASKARASRRFGARNYYSSFQSEESEDGLFGADEPVEEVGRNNKYKSLTFEDLGDLSDSGVANTHDKSASDDTSLVGSLEDHSLDKLLRSATGSSSKDRDRDSVGRALIGEKYLVQSFRSTSANTTKRAEAQGEGSDANAKGDWQTRFGHLGLIAADSAQDGAQGEEENNNNKPKQLFNEEADAKARQRAAAAQAREATMDYEEFMGKFQRTTELVDMTRDFIASVLGPNGDTTAPTSRKKLSYNFYGTHKLDQRCRQFFDQAQDQFLVWPEFKHETDERLICARDGIEQYIMSRIAEYAFKSSLDGEGDDLLSKRMKLLRFLKPEALEIKPELFDETLLAIAAEELRKINACKTPGDKVACVVKSASVIFRSLSLSRTKTDTDHSPHHPSSGISSSGQEDNTNIAGADDFLPLFIWVVMRSHIPRLCSNVAYVQTFLNPARLMGKWGYCLINLSSAIEFVKYIEADQLNIDQKEFDTKLTEAERELNGGFL